MYAPAASPCECGQFDWPQIVCGSSMGWGAVWWRCGARWRPRAPAPFCPVRMARTLHDTACRFSSPALLSLKTACSSLLFSLRIILYFFTYYLRNTSGSLISSNHKVVMHASSGLKLKASWLGASSGVHRRGSVGPVGMRVPPLVY